MTRPPRLLDSSSNDALRSLLSSGLDDAPDAHALPKVAAALGLSAVTVAASTLAASGVGAHAVSAKGAAIQSVALAGGAPATVAGSTGLSAGAALGALIERQRRPRRLDRLFQVLGALSALATLGALVLSLTSPVWKEQRLRELEAAGLGEIRTDP